MAARQTAVTLLAALAIACAGCLPQQPSRASGVSERNIEMEDMESFARQRLHHAGETFINPFASEPVHRRSLGQILRWKLFSGNPYRKEYERERVVPVKIDWSRVSFSHSTSVTWIAHASVLVAENGSRVLVDPVLFGLFWPVRDFSPLVFDEADLPDIEAVLVTHGHYDHLDIPSLKALAPRTGLFVVPLGYADLLRRNGIDRVRELDWYDTVRTAGFEVTFLPANHWTMRNIVEGPNRALWGSYLVKTAAGKTIYISGDTAYFEGFASIGARERIDLAVINLGAYEPRWFMKRSHLDPEEAVKAFQDLRAQLLLAVHWGTFRLGDEPVFKPRDDIEREMGRAGLADRLVRLEHGGMLVLE